MGIVKREVIVNKWFAGGQVTHKEVRATFY